ncbi:MAG: hypothetical protein Q3M24_01525 [Candidatus Electrothrix aestuarii]|uniref:CHAT domain-containing protein n=1 Tax=Candidatus Electrothrix aestuarii TaxID=3062594 RepID=A0AAU8LX67_9BACT|nr:hypothetical protein [Candidatus Electrothrix aestuarii]
MAGSCRYLVTLTEGHLQVARWGEERAIVSKTGPRLLPEARIRLKGSEISLTDLCLALNTYHHDWLTEFLDERGQLEIGQYLYQEIFGELTPYDLTEEGTGIELRIITKDEHIARLPWVLLAYNGVFLSAMGWGISLATAPPAVFCELPPRPKILAIMPQPKALELTCADEHLQEMKELLTAADLAYGDPARFRVVADLSSFYAELEDLQPDILYYYGHGIGNEQTTRLLFADQHGQVRETPLPDLAAALQSLPEHGRPQLAYINCCQGDSGGLLGVGRQLLPHIPAVVTNRTTAFIDAARPQALAFWEALLLRGEAPHTALTASHARLGGLGLTTADIRWMTPVLHCRYDTWTANPPEPPSRLERDPHWHLKVDRVNQFSKVFYQTHQMLLEQKPRGLAYLWYGTQDQGLEIFHRRLSVELQEKLTDIIVYPVKPEWPEDLYDPSRSFSDMLCHVFDVDKSMPEHISGRIREFSRRVSGRKTLVYICHRPVTPTKDFFDPKKIRLYLDWWNRKFLPLVPQNAHVLLGISYYTKNPAKFYRSLVQKERLDDFSMSHAVLEFLDELEQVTRRDLIDFIRTHRIAVPADLELRDKVIDEILVRSKGCYDRVIDELEYLESRIWQQGGEENVSAADEDDDYGL